jgi:hypothetical protein
MGERGIRWTYFNELGRLEVEKGDDCCLNPKLPAITECFYLSAHCFCCDAIRTRVRGLGDNATAYALSQIINSSVSSPQFRAAFLVLFSALIS